MPPLPVMPPLRGLTTRDAVAASPSVPTLPFVGRLAELQRLHALLPRGRSEPGRLVLLGGAAGSGKTRLVRTFGTAVAADGALVLEGACDPVLRTPYGPFVEALDRLIGALEPRDLATALDAGGGALARLLPELASRTGSASPAGAADADTERHRLHTAVARLLTTVAARRPVLVVLEDIHWSDAPTLLLLRHLARSSSTGMLLVVTFRDSPTELPDAVAETLGDLRRHDAVPLALTALSRQEVAQLVSRAGGGPLAAHQELASTIWRLTDGHAFLVCEMWRMLVESGAVEVTDGRLRVHRSPEELDSPPSVREVVRQRLARLAPATVDLLELASAAGTTFELDVVRRASGLSDAHLMDALDEALRSGILCELPGRSFGCRFEHELVRRALYDRLSGPRRAELHLRVAQALEQTGIRSGRALMDLAHHFASAAPFAPSARAAEYNVLAARSASSALDYDAAADRLRTALDLGVADDERPQLLWELGRAEHRSGRALEALSAFGRVAELAREREDTELLAAAAVGYEEACWRPAVADPAAADLLEEATAAYGEADSTMRVALLAGLARALDFLGRPERGARVRTEAIAMARRLGDRAGLAKVLTRFYWSPGTSSLEEILSTLKEACDLGREIGDAEVLADAMGWRVSALLAAGDLGSARRELVDLRETAERTAQPFMLHVADHHGSAIALCDGRLAEAEALANSSHEWGRLLSGRDSSGVYGIQMFGIRREQGRLAALAPVMRVLARDDQRIGPWRPGLVALLAELGMEDEARQELARIRGDGLDGFRPTLWLASLAYLTDACAALGDGGVAALVYPEMQRFSGGHVTVGHGVASYGAADRHLGMLAATLGDAARAQRHFEAGLALNRATGADTWTAHTAYEYGRLLLDRDASSSRAGALLGEAAVLARRIGMPSLLARIAALGSPTRGPAALPDDLSPREVQILGLVTHGLSNRRIGQELHISEHTAANHIRSILRKTGCANRTEAASYASVRGLTAR